ncbi:MULTISPECIES: IS3 family transposase [Rodentibacter]
MSFAELEQTFHDYVRYYNNGRIQVKLKGLSLYSTEPTP